MEGVALVDKGLKVEREVLANAREKERWREGGEARRRDGCFGPWFFGRDITMRRVHVV